MYYQQNNLNISKKSRHCKNCDKIPMLQMQLTEALNHIQVLRKNNRQLLEKLQTHEQQRNRIITLQDENSFLKQNQKQLKQRINSYKVINEKLGQQLYHENQDSSKKAITMSTPKKSQRDYSYQDKAQIQKNRPSIIDNGISDRFVTERSILSELKVNCQQQESGKKNHLLTPKSKVKINLDCLPQFDYSSSFQKINARRKAFM